MTQKQRLHIQIPRPEERSPVEYGLFVESCFFALGISAEVENGPLPAQLDEVDQHLLSKGLRPTPALRGPLVGIMRLSERCQENPQYQALMARCGALLDLIPHLPPDLMLEGAEADGPHPVVFEMAAEMHLNANFTFMRSLFLQEARSRLSKYPCVQQALAGKLVGALQSRFPEMLHSDLRSVRLFLGGEVPLVEVWRQWQMGYLYLMDVPQRPGQERCTMIANLTLALRWLMEAPLETLVRIDPKGCLFNPQTCKQA